MQVADERNQPSYEARKALPKCPVYGMRLAQPFDRIAPELREFVEEQDAMVL